MPLQIKPTVLALAQMYNTTSRFIFEYILVVLTLKYYVFY